MQIVSQQQSRRRLTPLQTFKDGSLDVEPDPDVFDDGLHAVGDVVLHELLANLLRLVLLNQNKNHHHTSLTFQDWNRDNQFNWANQDLNILRKILKASEESLKFLNLQTNFVFTLYKLTNQEKWCSNSFGRKMKAKSRNHNLRQPGMGDISTWGQYWRVWQLGFDKEILRYSYHGIKNGWLWGNIVDVDNIDNINKKPATCFCMIIKLFCFSANIDIWHFLQNNNGVIKLPLRNFQTYRPGHSPTLRWTLS